MMSLYKVQAGLKISILLLLPPESWDGRFVPGWASPVSVAITAQLPLVLSTDNPLPVFT